MNKKNRKQKPKNKILHGIGIFFRIVFIVVFAAIAITGGVVVGSLASYIENTELLDVQNLSINLTSFVYAEDEYGNTYQLETLYDDENRVWASLDEIPLNLQRAFIAIEDERFFQHKGFDLKRTIGASISYIKNKLTNSADTTYGGSTLTQQLIKNITGEDDYSVGRKIQEIYRAYMLEKELTKNQILEMYLNTIYLSQQCNGVKSAAKVYFNKELYELTLPECATIAAITQYPSKYDPKRNPENNKERRNVILAKMCELGYITEEERAEAAATEVVTVAKSETNGYSSTTSYYTDALIEQVIDDLVEQKGYTEAIAKRMIYCGGFKIYSAVDTSIQSVMDAYYADDSHFPSISSDVMAQSAMVIIDPNTGYVKGLIGGRGVKEGSRTLNRATQTLRQSGSSIKPLSIYAPAIEYGKVTPTTIVSDSPITINGWSPRNDDKVFKGNISVASALAGSRNVPAIRILQYLGLDRSYNFVQRNFHISSLVDSREQNGKIYSDKTFAAIGLGGLTDGVSVLEMAAAYVPFDSGGYYYEPSFYTRIENSYGEVILRRDPVPQPAISESTAVTMTEMLQNVTKSGTGTSARLSNMPTAGKTGTTTNNYDRWFVGYTPYYVGAVWFGYDIPRSLKGVSGNPSAKVWRGIMEQVHENLEYKSFPSLGSTSKVLVCADSGLLPNSTCENLTFGEYSKNAAPKKRCTLHDETDEGTGKLIVYTPPKTNEPSDSSAPSSGEISDGIDTPQPPVESPDSGSQEVSPPANTAPEINTPQIEPAAVS